MLQTFGVLFGIIGLLIVGFMFSWWLSLGVFMMIYGNNLELKSRDYL